MTDIRKPYTFDRVIRILFGISTVIIIVYVLNLLKGVLLPFLVACIIAYALEPLVRLNKKLLHIRARFIPVMLTLIEVTLFFGTAAYLLVPYIISETEQMVEMLQRYMVANISIPYLPPQVHEFIRDYINPDNIVAMLSEERWQDLIKKAISSSWSFLSEGLSVIFGLLSWCIVFLYVVFIMIDYEKLMLSFRQLIPHSHRERVIGIFRDVKGAMNCYFADRR